MISYISSFIWTPDEVEIRPDEKQKNLRHLLMKQIVERGNPVKIIRRPEQISVRKRRRRK